MSSDSAPKPAGQDGNAPKAAYRRVLLRLS